MVASSDVGRWSGGECSTSEPLYPSEIISFHSETPALNPTYLSHKYLKEGKSANDIAKELHVSRSFVLDKLKKAAIPRRADRIAQLAVKVPSTHAPFGYKPINGKLVSFAKEQKVIELIKKLRLMGKPYTAIAALLNQKNVPTKKGGKWHHFTIKGILERELKNEKKEDK